eukprot:1161662-Pelagomonas_calceolata.AAC.11
MDDSRNQRGKGSNSPTKDFPVRFSLAFPPVMYAASWLAFERARVRSMKASVREVAVDSTWRGHVHSHVNMHPKLGWECTCAGQGSPTQKQLSEAAALLPDASCPCTVLPAPGLPIAAVVSGRLHPSPCVPSAFSPCHPQCLPAPGLSVATVVSGRLHPSPCLPSAFSPCHPHCLPAPSLPSVTLISLQALTTADNQPEPQAVGQPFLWALTTADNQPESQAVGQTL